MIINFVTNKDGKTCSMFENGVLVKEEIPYVPEKCVDHRGLYFYLQNESGELTLDESIENKEEVIRGYNYMFNPIFVKQAINNFNNRI